MYLSPNYDWQLFPQHLLKSHQIRNINLFMVRFSKEGWIFKISQNHMHFHPYPQTPVDVVNPACSWSELLGNQLEPSPDSSPLSSKVIFFKLLSSYTWRCLPSYSCSCLPRTGSNFHSGGDGFSRRLKSQHLMKTTEDSETRAWWKCDSKGCGRHGRASSPKWPSTSVDRLPTCIFSK